MKINKSIQSHNSSERGLLKVAHAAPAARIAPITKGKKLKETLSQKWTYNTYSKLYYDQFGFVVHYGEQYALYWHDQFIVKCLSLSAAREISLILVNDIILHKKI
jgi:hypothetical protein